MKCDRNTLTMSSVYSYVTSADWSLQLLRQLVKTESLKRLSWCPKKYNTLSTCETLVGVRLSNISSLCKAGVK